MAAANNYPITFSPIFPAIIVQSYNPIPIYPIIP